VAHSGRRNCIRNVNNPAQIFTTEPQVPHIQSSQKPLANKRDASAWASTALMTAAEGTEQFANSLESFQNQLLDFKKFKRNLFVDLKKQNFLQHPHSTHIVQQRIPCNLYV